MAKIMKTFGEYQSGGLVYSVMMQDTGKESVLVLVNNNTIYSAFKRTIDTVASFNNNTAKEAYEFLEKGYKFCNSKNVSPSPFELGVSSRYELTKFNTNYMIEKFDGATCGCEIASDEKYLFLKYNADVNIPVEKIPWVTLTTEAKIKRKIEAEANYNMNDEFKQSSLDDSDIPVRTLEEISLEKDLTWLKSKKYYVVNDDVTAEKVLRAIEHVALVKKGIVSYDTETSGLFINKFGKIGSRDKREIDEINAQRIAEKKTPYRVDKLVGHILCVEKDVSYYFPVGHRKFRNLYEFNEDGTCNEMTRNTVNWIKANYTIGEHRNRTDSMATFIRETEPEKWGSDVILMERCRKILELGHILAHNGIFEWKVSWLYNICINLQDDTMVMHKLMYKFRSTTKNMGERSDLKFLSGKDLEEQHINQLELSDFFVGYKEDENMLVQGNSAAAKKKQKKKSLKIDFSYMTLEGAEAYAPADGDLTLCLCIKYKKDLKANFANLEYLYNVELRVSCAIAYMEFYGHKIDEEKIEDVKWNTQAEKILYEHDIREAIHYSSIEEDELAEILKLKQEKIKGLNSELKKMTGVLKETEDYKSLKDSLNSIVEDRKDCIDKLRTVIENSDKFLKLTAPAQVAKLLFIDLGYEAPNTADGKLSVGKKILKKYMGLKNPDGTSKYPVIELYAKWKNADTLLSKFFDNLPDYMYPGGFIFSSYGQISTATGRMSCSKPNAQQYPKSITEIVVPREDCIMMDADFSQIEYRTLVAMANEPELLIKFRDPDNDYHTMMASLMYGVPYAAVTPKMRGDAKSFNFGIPYGMGFKSLAILLSGDPTPSAIEEAKEKYELYFKEQPNVRKFFVDIKEKTRNNQFTETKWHRKRYYSFLKNGEFNNSSMAMALRQAGNAVIQGTSADIFKIAVARTYTYIRDNNLFEKLYITNLVHDEQLTECNCKELDAQVALKGLIECMELELEGFPPLFVGAGVGLSWKEAKGKMAEIHPVLAKQLIEEAKDKNILTLQNEEIRDAKDILATSRPMEPDEAVKYFDKRVFAFREKKVIDYVMDEDNWNKPLHPAVGNLMALQFDYNATKEYETEYVYNKDTEAYTKEQKAEAQKKIPEIQLARFFEEYKIDLDAKMFSTDTFEIEKQSVEDEYDDEEIDDDMDIEYERLESEFALIDESDEVYGIDIRDIIKQYGLCIDASRKICGINTAAMTFKRKDEMAEYMEKHVCDKEDSGALQICYLKENNTMFYTGIYVKDITGSRMSTLLKLNALAY